MSLSSGFYNSLNHDRRYFASEFSRLFDGIILDGIFSTIGTCFIVEAYEGLTVNVGIGLAWFNHSWSYNDAILPVNGIQSEVLLDRIDALVLESNGEDSVRDNRIFFIKGTPSSNPKRPTLLHTALVDQRPLCYVYRQAGVDEIRQADITNMIGTDDCPFVSGILKTISIDQVLPQWRDELDRFIEDEESDFNGWSEQEKAGYLLWFEEMKKIILSNKEAFDSWTERQKTDLAEYFSQLKSEGNSNLLNLTQQLIDFRNTNEAEFLKWFEMIKGVFSTDAAGELLIKIGELTDQVSEMEEMLLSGRVMARLLTDDGKYLIDDMGNALLADRPICGCK